MSAVALALSRAPLQEAAPPEVPSCCHASESIQRCCEIGAEMAYNNGFVAGMKDEKARGDKAIVFTVIATPVIILAALGVANLFVPKLSEAFV